MPCDPMKASDGRVIGIVCSRGNKSCCNCGAPAPLLCDGVVGGEYQLGLVKMRSRTCDAPICRKCATHVGIDRDLCPECSRRAR